MFSFDWFILIFYTIQCKIKFTNMYVSLKSHLSKHVYLKWANKSNLVSRVHN